jgi:hypothetical protein
MQWPAKLKMRTEIRLGNIRKQLKRLIERARALGLPEQDCHTALELVAHHEWGLAYDMIVTQMFEYDIPADLAYTSLAEKLANRLGFSNERRSQPTP